MKNALLRMRESLNTASATEKTIIKHILAHPDDLLTCSIHALAEQTYSSPATILRLCRKLGFDGYKDFRQSVIYELALRKQSQEEEQKEITQHDSLEQMVQKITYKNINSLKDSCQLIDVADIQTAVDMIERSQVVYLFGIGSSLCVAHDLYLKFLRLGKACVLNDDWHGQLLQARNATAQDAAIILSYSGQTVEVISCMKEMHENNVPMVSITRYGASPVTQLSSLCLYVAANESLFRSGAMSSRISQLNLIDILYTEFANRNYQRSLAQLSKTHIHKPG